jgi:hypothetical protein
MNASEVKRYHCIDVNGRTFSIMTAEKVDDAWIAQQNEGRAKMFGRAAIVSCVEAQAVSS